MTNSDLAKLSRVGWLRAAVLGANDGLGVAAGQSSIREIIIAGVAGAVAGAMSMAAGEYVSVSSQSDAVGAALVREQKRLDHSPEAQQLELAELYISRGLEPDLATKVAEQMMAKDALGVHAREEFGITDLSHAQPLQAALASASAFALGALLPLLVALVTPVSAMVVVISLVTLLLLGSLGALGAYLGGAPIMPAVLRVGFWGTAALAATGAVGWLFGVAVH